MECKLCNIKTNNLESHHFIPKSKGGLDNDNNLIKVCIKCHGLIHNVDFKGRGGLVSEAIKKSELKEEQAAQWLIDNTNLVEKKMIYLLDNDIEKLHFINHLLHNHQRTFRYTHLKDFVLNKKTKFNITL